MPDPGNPTHSGQELPLRSPWCQRWGLGRLQSWRHRSEGGFDHRRYEASELDETTAKAWSKRHYSGTYPAARFRFGMWDVSASHTEPRLVGVAVLSVGVNKKTLTGLFPDLEPYEESLELGRFLLSDDVPANGESFFIGQVLKLSAAKGVRAVGSFADPVARTTLDGRIYFPGHLGIIYQAANFIYTGRSAARYLRLLPDGTVLSPRAITKLNRDETGHEYVEQLLQRHGADPRLPGEPAADYLDRAERQARVRRLYHPGNHRYCVRLGRTRAERSRVVIGLTPRPYPKQLSWQTALDFGGPR